MIPTIEQFRNAVYLDFEGRKSIGCETLPLPHMAGFFRPYSKGTNGKYQVTFFRDHWKPAVNGSQRRAQLQLFPTCFEEIEVELQRQDKLLIYWTMHEEAILEKHLPTRLFLRLKPRLFNLHPLARRYANRFRKFGAEQTARGKTLEEFFAAMYRKRKPYPPLPIGASVACQRIDSACERTQRWRKFTANQKSYVKDLLAYNEGDCRATWLIAKRLGNFYGTRT